LLRGALSAQRHLDPALERGQGRAELMSRIGREAPDVGERLLQPVEHRVQRLGEMVQLVSRSAEGKAAGEILGSDATGRTRHPIHGVERGASQ